MYTKETFLDTNITLVNTFMVLFLRLEGEDSYLASMSKYTHEKVFAWHLSLQAALHSGLMKTFLHQSHFIFFNSKVF